MITKNSVIYKSFIELEGGWMPVIDECSKTDSHNNGLWQI